MSVIVALFVARLIGAVLLLVFIGYIGWIIYQDMRVTAQVLSERQRRYGSLCLLVADADLGDASAPVGTEQRFPLLPVTSLGRAPSNSIVINDTYASAEHALLTLRGQQWWLEDLGSRNGTRLNGIAVEGGTVVSGGDVIMIGGTRLRIELA